jgi:hypothetical protein
LERENLKGDEYFKLDVAGGKPQVAIAHHPDISHGIATAATVRKERKPIVAKENKDGDWKEFWLRGIFWGFHPMEDRCGGLKLIQQAAWVLILAK